MGALGHALRKLQEFSFDFAPDAALILHSDGLSRHWELAGLARVSYQNIPALIAGVLYRDHYRARDDVTVVVIKRGMGT